MICWVIVWCDADTFEGGGKKTNSRLAFALTFPLTLFNDNMWAVPPFFQFLMYCEMARGISGRLFAFVEKEGGGFATHPCFSFQVWGVYLHMTQPFFSCPCMCDPLFISETPRWAPVSLLLLSLVFGDGAVDANICYPISMIATLYINDTENLYEYWQLYRWWRYWFPILRISIPVVGIVDKAPALE